MPDKVSVSNSALEWLSLRLERAIFVETTLKSLISKGIESDEDKKLYQELSLESKTLSIKDVLSIYSTTTGDSEDISGFEDFECL